MCNQEKSAKLVIVRGLPGSGKSTLASLLGLPNFEADMFMVNAQGDYDFNVNKLHYAHCQCQTHVENCLKKGEDVSVSNTFTKASEFNEYLNLALQYNAKVSIIECMDNYGSIHGVPAKTMEKMRLRFADKEAILAYAQEIIGLNIDDIDYHYSKDRKIDEVVTF